MFVANPSIPIAAKRETISGWGNHRREECWVARPRDEADIDRFMNGIGTGTWIPRGLGRSYGDSAVNGAGSVLDVTQLRSLHQFNAHEGWIVADAGISLGRIIDAVLPEGWFLPVTPGSQYITLGGAVAADVHGKNHHRDGSLGEFVVEFVLQTSDGRLLTCKRDLHPELFLATLGGMGLTGLIRRVKLRLLKVPSAYVRVSTIKTSRLDETLDVVQALSEQYRYAVAWVDCLARGASQGRGFLLLGEHLSADELPRHLASDPLSRPRRRQFAVPFTPPSFLLNSWSCRAFNDRVHSRQSDGEKVVDLDRFFYPLDNLARWNRLYGRRGFIEYQAVLPHATARKGIHQILRLTADHGFAPFFAGLKTFGPGSGGLLSFPMPGVTFAFDVPVLPRLWEMAAALDRVVTELGGRVYLAKDSTLSAAAFGRMYPELEKFRSIRSKIDPRGRLRSSQAARLGLSDK